MSNLAITPQWHDTINQVETTEVIMGGANGNANLATKQLAESLLWLKQQFESKKTENYKVGDVYVTTINHADAAAVKAHHGYGTWAREAEGRAIVGYSSQADSPEWTKINGNMYGEDKVQLTTEELPDHKHQFVNSVDGSIAANSRHFGVLGLNEDVDFSTIQSKELGYSTDSSTDSAFLQSTKAGAGGNQPHNNVQPSKIYNIWLRTA